MYHSSKLVVRHTKISSIHVLGGHKTNFIHFLGTYKFHDSSFTFSHFCTLVIRQTKISSIHLLRTQETYKLVVRHTKISSIYVLGGHKRNFIHFLGTYKFHDSSFTFSHFCTVVVRQTKISSIHLLRTQETNSCIGWTKNISETKLVVRQTKISSIHLSIHVLGGHETIFIHFLGTYKFHDSSFMFTHFCTLVVRQTKISSIHLLRTHETNFSLIFLVHSLNNNI